MYKILSLLIGGLTWARERIARGRSPTTPHDGDGAPPCDDGCYSLADGTLVPLGDLGVSPRAFDLEP